MGENLISKMEDFLVETILYYGKEPKKMRCAREGKCFYNPENAGKPESEGCAIGRKLEKSVSKRFDLYTGRIDSLPEDLYLLLPDDLKEMGLSFLFDIQRLHDSEKNWSDTGLTFLGETKVNEVIKKFNLRKDRIQKMIIAMLYWKQISKLNICHVTGNTLMQPTEKSKIREFWL